MGKMPQLVDQYGRPVDVRRLTEEESAPTLAGVRQVLSDHPSRGLTPQRLAAILTESEEGDATRYLELAEDMEEKDQHYLAQLGTRKRAIAQLAITVESASDAVADVRAADGVREYLRSDDLEEVFFDILDAVGKGYSVCEILWDTSEREWLPHLVRRDPRWFGFDPVDGTTLRLREGVELRPLTPYKYLVHTHRAKSGLPIRGGLARASAWGYLFKNLAIKNWVAFAEIFGQPYRVGKYHPSASSDDRQKLLRAVSSIGSDAAAIIPEGMLIEFIEAQRYGTVNVYETLAAYVDSQTSKAVLGQTLTSDSGSNGSRALGTVHNEVRRDIMRSDALQVAATLNRQLVRPFVDLNMGPRRKYPRLKIGLPDELSTAEKIEALTKMVPVGLRVEASQVRDQLGYTEPAADADVLGPAASPAPGAPTTPAAQAAARRLREAAALRAVHAAAAARDAIDDQVQGALDDGGWEPLVDPITAPIAALLDETGSLEEFRDRLVELVRTMDTAQLVELLARNAFAARAAGELGLDLSAQEPA
jgi:phage gp29-like protein